MSLETRHAGRRPDEATTRLLAGRCECGAVRYRVADTFRYAANCHCSNCRASTGSAFKPFAGIERDKLEIVQGADRLLVWGDDDANHTRCGVCGSLVYSVVRDGAYVHGALGCLSPTAAALISRSPLSPTRRRSGRRSTSSPRRRRRGSTSPTSCRRTTSIDE